MLWVQLWTSYPTLDLPRACPGCWRAGSEDGHCPESSIPVMDLPHVCPEPTSLCLLGVPCRALGIDAVLEPCRAGPGCRGDGHCPAPSASRVPARRQRGQGRAAAARPRRGDTGQHAERGPRGQGGEPAACAHRLQPRRPAEGRALQRRRSPARHRRGRRLPAPLGGGHGELGWTEGLARGAGCAWDAVGTWGNGCGHSGLGGRGSWHRHRAAATIAVPMAARVGQG